ncbi:hypothetical protein HPB49_016602 [Dermacentor silvarum]|uniref:Uncharacterized protein n=1 Tax=Dermacentor silvarum TaxID=543639 RepID=A0ACB8CLZ3_DERSI|nr:hypothetical protein HPB49_016602 [Dermacentor silvarum]
MTIGLLAFGPSGDFGWFARSPAVGYITTGRSPESEQQALLVVPSTAVRRVVNTTVTSTAAMGTELRRRRAADAAYAVGETLLLQLFLVIIALLSNAWAQHAVGSSDEARSLTSRGADTLVRWNISPAALQHMRSESFKRQFSPWGGKRNAAAFESLMDSPGDQQSHRHQLAADAVVQGKRASGDRFGAWGGKRGTFSAWGGKRQQESKNAFSPWGGKRAVRSPLARSEGTARARQDDGEEDEERTFAPWGGKRGSRGRPSIFPMGREKG